MPGKVIMALPGLRITAAADQPVARLLARNDGLDMLPEQTTVGVGHLLIGVNVAQSLEAPESETRGGTHNLHGIAIAERLARVIDEMHERRCGAHRVQSQVTAPHIPKKHGVAATERGFGDNGAGHEGYDNICRNHKLSSATMPHVGIVFDVEVGFLVFLDVYHLILQRRMKLTDLSRNVRAVLNARW